MHSTCKVTGVGKNKAFKPLLLMPHFLDGRKNVDAYAAFFDTFLPCATKKTTWDGHIARAGMEARTKTVTSLCSVSDEAFALLLLENSFDRWFDLHVKRSGNARKDRGSKERDFQSDVAPLYTTGGIKYDKTDVSKSVKGWSNDGRERFNALFDQVKQDRKDYPLFDTNWLRLRRQTQESQSAPNKRKHQAVTTRSELFDSEEEEEGDLAGVHDSADGPGDVSDDDD